MTAINWAPVAKQAAGKGARTKKAARRRRAAAGLAMHAAKRRTEAK